MTEDSLNKRYSIKLFANIISGIIGAVIVGIVPRELGPIAYGQFTYLQVFFSKIVDFLDMNASIAFFTKLSARNARRELITFYFIYILFILLLTTVITYLIDTFGYIEILLPDIPKQYVYIGLLFSFFTWLTQIYMKISDAFALTVSVELIKIIHKVLSFLLLIYFIYQTTFNLDKYFSFHFISLITFILVLSWLYIKKDIFNIKIITLKIEFKRLIKEFIEYCSPLVIYSFLGLFVGLFDIWLLQKIAGSEQTGFYGLSVMIAGICFVFSSAMTPIITREFSKSYEENDLEKIKKLFFRYIPMLYSIAAYFGIFVSIQSENLLEIFADEKFKDAYFVLVLMAFYPIHQTYGQLSGSVFYATEQTKLYKNIGIVGMSIGIIMSFSFIYILDLGATGLAWKMILGQLIIVNIQLYFNAKFLDFKMKHFIFHQLYSIFFFIVLAYLSSNIFDFNSSIINFLVSGIIYTFLVIIFAYIFPQIFSITRHEINIIVNKIIKIRIFKIKI